MSKITRYFRTLFQYKIWRDNGIINQIKLSDGNGLYENRYVVNLSQEKRKDVSVDDYLEFMKKVFDSSVHTEKKHLHAGGSFLKGLYEELGSERFIALLNSVELYTNKKGVKFIKSLKLSK